MLCSTARSVTVVAAVLITTFSGHVAGRESTLTPGASLNRETLHFDTERVRYSLQHLRPNTGYEVRVSYPATVPSKVTLQLIRAKDGQTPYKHRRRLLDTEKIIFYTGQNGLYQGREHIVEMQAEATGIHRDGPEAKPKEFLYNIALEELVLGIPKDAFPVVVMVIIVVVGVWLLVPWWVDVAVPAMLRFMAAGRDKTAEAHES